MKDIPAPVSNMNLSGFVPLTPTCSRMRLLSISRGIRNELLPESKRIFVAAADDLFLFVRWAQVNEGSNRSDAQMIGVRTDLDRKQCFTVYDRADISFVSDSNASGVAASTELAHLTFI